MLSNPSETQVYERPAAGAAEPSNAFDDVAAEFANVLTHVCLKRAVRAGDVTRRLWRCATCGYLWAVKEDSWDEVRWTVQNAVIASELRNKGPQT
jgi:rubrerythrin